MIAQRMKAGREMSEQSIAQVIDGTQVELGRLEAIESGKELPGSLEIAVVSSATGLPIRWFMEDRPQLVASRKAAPEGGYSPLFDIQLERIAVIVEELLEKGVLSASRRDTFEIPNSHDEAARVAAQVRRAAGIEHAPIEDLTAVCEEIGLLAFSREIVGSPFIGALSEVDSPDGGAVGIALITNHPESMRPRFTLAHELGHWVFGTTYQDGCGHQEIERYMNSFAAHLLMPRELVSSLRQQTSDDRKFAMAVSAVCGASWTATLLHLLNLGFILPETHHLESQRVPTAAEFEQCGHRIPQVADLGQVPPNYRAKVLHGYKTRVLPEGKTLEALFGSTEPSELPSRAEVRNFAS